MTMRQVTVAGEGRSTAAEARLLARVVAAAEEGAPSTAGTPPSVALLQKGLVVERGGRLFATALGCAKAARTNHPAGYLAQHRAVERRTVATEHGPESLLVDLDESPLAWLARRKGKDGRPLLAPAEIMAGETLRADFTRAQMTPRVTANWEAAVSSGRRSGAALDVADAVIAARERVRRAVEAVGPELSGALLDVCCFLKGLEEVERDRGWPARGAKLVLGLGLARLARHYGLVAEGSANRRIVRWGTADSRPTIDG